MKSTRTRRIAIWCRTVCFFCLLPLAGNSFAVPFTRVDISTPGGAVIPTLNPTSPLSYFEPAPDGSQSARGFATFGSLKAETFATDGGLSSAGAFVSTLFHDSLSISSAGRAGTTGFADIAIDYNWGMRLPGVVTSTYLNFATLSLTLGSEFTTAREQHNRDGQTITANLEPAIASSNTIVRGAVLGQFLDVRMPIMFGSALNLTMELTAQSLVHDGTVAISAFNSAYWGGMSVLDASFAPVSFTVASESGADYSRSFVPVQSVPEPATVGLLVVGVLALRRARR